MDVDRLDLLDLLKEFSFTQYEAKILDTLIRYILLSARDIHKYSGVPQPKIYENLLLLQNKGLVDVIHRKKKKLFMIKPKEMIQEYLLNFSKHIQTIGDKSLEIIDKIYSTEEAEEIPFMGVAGQDAIQEFIYMLIDTAKKSFISFFPLNFFDSKILGLLMKKVDDIDIKIVLLDDVSDVFIEEYKQLGLYRLNTPAFDVIKEIISKIEHFLPTEHGKAYSFQIIKDLALNIKEIFGIILIDDKKSFFKIPLPVKLPMAILSSLPELVEFHTNGINAILASSTKI
jgi:sugar-specific transcriptional regulator TrmB